MKTTLKTKADYQALQAACMTGEISDGNNPAFTFQMTNSAILLAIVNGDVDALLLAKLELAARGLGPDGQWAKDSNKAWGL